MSKMFYIVELEKYWKKNTAYSCAMEKLYYSSDLPRSLCIVQSSYQQKKTHTNCVYSSVEGVWMVGEQECSATTGLTGNLFNTKPHFLEFMEIQFRK